MVFITPGYELGFGLRDVRGRRVDGLRKLGLRVGKDTLDSEESIGMDIRVREGEVRVGLPRVSCMTRILSA